MEIHMLDELYNNPKSTPKTPNSSIKNAGREAGYDYSTFTIKKGLSSFIKYKQDRWTLIPLIRGDVKYITSEMPKFTLFVNWWVKKHIDDGDQFFNEINDNTWNKLFNQLRDSEGVDANEFLNLSHPKTVMRADSEYRTNIVKNALRLFAANMKTTIRENIKRSLRKYYQNVDEEQSKKKSHENRKYVDDLMKGGIVLEPWNIDFAKVKDYQLIPTLFQIQMLIHKKQQQLKVDDKSMKGVKLISVVPLWTSKQKHVLYDKAAFTDLLNQKRKKELKVLKNELDKVELKLKTTKKLIGMAAKRKLEKNIQKLKFNIKKKTSKIYEPRGAMQTRKRFSRYFRFRRLEKPRVNISSDDDLKQLINRFNGSFSTNGVDVSIHLDRKVPKPPKTKMIQIPPPLDDFKHFFSIDPGYAYQLGAVLMKLDGGDGSNFVTFLQKAKSWHGCTGFGPRMEQRKRQYESKMNVIAKKREELDNIGRSHPNFINFTQFELSILAQVDDIFNQHEYTKIGWRKKIKVRQEIDRLVEKVLPKDGKTLVGYGNGPMKSTSKG